MVVMVILGLIGRDGGIAVVGAADRARVDRTKTESPNPMDLDSQVRRHGRYPGPGSVLKALGGRDHPHLIPRRL